MARHFRPERLVVGLSLVALGILGTLARSGAVDFLAALHTGWPLTFVVWGLAELYNTFAARAAERSQ